MTDENYTIGKVALLAGVGIETIRFYERRKLLEIPPRNGSGYRVYGVEVVERILFIKQARELKFSLAEIRLLLQGYEKNADYRAMVQALLLKKSREVDAQLRHLQTARQKIDQLLGVFQSGEDCDNRQLVALILEGIVDK